MIGWVLVFRSTIGLVLNIILFLLLLSRMADEEKFLEAEFGDEYRAYREKTRRLFRSYISCELWVAASYGDSRKLRMKSVFASGVTLTIVSKASIIGFAARPGTLVLPTCSTAIISSPRTAFISSAMRLKSAGHRSS